jgi:hypothetical protein
MKEGRNESLKTWGGDIKKKAGTKAKIPGEVILKKWTGRSL